MNKMFAENDIEVLNTLNKISTYETFIFNQVVRYDSMDAAANILNLPLLKIQLIIKSLEKNIQEPLMISNQERVILTKKGKEFAEFARNLVDQFRICGENFGNDNNDIVIGYHYTFSGTIFPDIISKFSNNNPDVRIYLEDCTESLELMHNDLDVLIGPQTLNLPGYNCVHIKDDPHYLYASPGYIRKYGDPASFADFKQHKLMTLTNQNYYLYEIFKDNISVLTSTSKVLLYEMAILGQGIAALPKSQLKSADIKNKKLVEVIKGVECSKDSISFITRNLSLKKKLTNDLYETIMRYI